MTEIERIIKEHWNDYNPSVIPKQELAKAIEQYVKEKEEKSAQFCVRRIDLLKERHKADVIEARIAEICNCFPEIDHDTGMIDKYNPPRELTGRQEYAVERIAELKKELGEE